MRRPKTISLVLAAAAGILMGIAVLSSGGCVATSKNVIASYPTKDTSKKVQESKTAEWEKLNTAYGPAEVEIFYVGDTKIKRYTYYGNNVIYRVLFYNDKIDNIVTDR